MSSPTTPTVKARKLSTIRAAAPDPSALGAPPTPTKQRKPSAKRIRASILGESTPDALILAPAGVPDGPAQDTYNAAHALIACNPTTAKLGPTYLRTLADALDTLTSACASSPARKRNYQGRAVVKASGASVGALDTINCDKLRALIEGDRIVRPNSAQRTAIIGN